MFLFFLLSFATPIFFSHAIQAFILSLFSVARYNGTCLSQGWMNQYPGSRMCSLSAGRDNAANGIMLKDNNNTKATPFRLVTRFREQIVYQTRLFDHVKSSSHERGL